MKTSTTILFGLFLLLQSSCTFAIKGIKGNGNVIKQERSISGVNGLEIGGAFNVYLTQGNEEKLVIEADENLLDIIVSRVKDGTLYIETKKSITGYKVLNVYLTVKELKEMEISGACSVTGKTLLKQTTLDLDCSGASKINLKLEITSLTLDISGASKVKLSGYAPETEIDISGASKLDAAELETENTDVEASGASSATIFVTGNLEAEVSGAAKVRYKGNAALSKSEVSGAGSLKRLD